MTDLDEADMKRIAAACNSAVWFLQRSTGDQVAPTPRLEDAPPWAVESTYDSIRAVLAGVTMEQLWQHWAAAKRKAGWVHGDVKDPVAKTHPCLTAGYSQLPAREKYKDRVFLGIIRLAREGQLGRMSSTGQETR
jgi:hypothetical protein